MALQITLHSFGMAGEKQQLQEIVNKAVSAKKGETILFPEYGAYTVEGSQKAFSELSKVASRKGITLITSLNLSSEDLPYSDPNTNHNTLFIFSRNGQIYSPQAKITPQSFEMQHGDETSPRMNVAPYNHLNKVTLRQNGEEFHAFFFICSDLYVLSLFNFDQLKSDAIVCPANFGNGAEGSACDVMDYVVNSGLFNQGFLCNTYQNVKTDLIPYTLGVERAFEAGGKDIPHNKAELGKILKRSSVVYPDDGYFNFRSMLELTQNGTFTIPYSRSLANGLKVDLGVYERVITL